MDVTQTASNHKNLKLLWWLRNIALLGQVSAVFTVSHLLAMPLPTTPLFIIMGGIICLNMLTWLRIKAASIIADNEFFFQLLLDMGALFGLLYFTGGATNPFTSLFILQVVIAAITLPALYSAIAAGISIILYTLLMLWNVKIPYLQHHHLDGFFNLHVQGMWLSFIILASIVAWFVVRMNIIIRRQDALLAETEKMAALGALATNAAHELGTPLATIAILAEACEPAAFQRLTEQIHRCKHIISRITAAGGVMRAEGGTVMPIDIFLKETAEYWQKDHPKTILDTAIHGTGQPRILADYTFRQTLLNLLDNAADASPEYVRLEANWNLQNLMIRIEDKGNGIAAHIKDQLGHGAVTTKEHGMGLGLLLAKNCIQRLGGVLELTNMSKQGAVATISLPLKGIAL